MYFLGLFSNPYYSSLLDFTKLALVALKTTLKLQSLEYWKYNNCNIIFWPVINNHEVGYISLLSGLLNLPRVVRTRGTCGRPHKKELKLPAINAFKLHQLIPRDSSSTWPEILSCFDLADLVKALILPHVLLECWHLMQNCSSFQRPLGPARALWEMTYWRHLIRPRLHLLRGRQLGLPRWREAKTPSLAQLNRTYKKNNTLQNKKEGNSFTSWSASRWHL